MEKSRSFVFKTKDQLKAMSFRERAIYFEDLLGYLYSQQDEFGELKRQHLARTALRNLSAGVATALSGRHAPVPLGQLQIKLLILLHKFHS